MLNGHTTAKDQTKSKSTSNEDNLLVDREPLPNTPFEIIGNKEKGYFVALGKYRLTDTAKTKKETLNYITNFDNVYDIALKMIITLTSAMIQEHEERLHKAKIVKDPLTNNNHSIKAVL